MRPITSLDMLNARIKLGELWGLGRQLTLGEMGHLVGLAAGSASDTIFQIEEGKRQASGPVSLVIYAMLDGWEPPTKAAALKDTKASTSVRGPHGAGTRAPTAGKLAGRKIIGATDHVTEFGMVGQPKSPPATWAGDPRNDGEDDGEGR